MTDNAVRILIIEDNPPDQDLYCHLLNRIAEDGYCLQTADSGEAGLVLYQAHPPDCILLDYQLPGLNGLEVLTALTDTNGEIPVPVIMLTGEGCETLAAEAIKAGAADYLPKRLVSAKSLRRTITNAIEKYKLRAALKEQHKILAETNERLHRKNTEIQQFYHMLSHELKTPLTAAREFVAIVLDGLAGPLNDTQHEYLSYAKESCDQMTLGLNDLLDATRLDTGKLPLTLQPASIGNVVLRTMTSMAPQAQAQGIQWQHVVSPTLPLVCIDIRRIAQVLTNLLNNALKFTPPGGEIVVKVDNDPPRSDRVLVAVSDTGRGIEPEQRDYIFDRLYQIRSDDAAIEGGLGLGLYICREVVRLHGGKIWVDSVPGKGSTFFFTVPVYSGCTPVDAQVKREITP